MKLSKLFIIIATLSIGLSACNKGKEKKSEESEDTTNVASEESEESIEESLSEEESESDGLDFVPAEEGGSTFGFPTEAIKTFRNLYNKNASIYPIGTEETYWKWRIYFEDDFSPVLKLETPDYGTPGENAMEDTMLATLLAAGVDVVTSQHESKGYFVNNEKGNMEYRFYTWADSFYFLYFAEPIPKPNKFPLKQLNMFLNANLKEQISFIAPEGNEWLYYSYEKVGKGLVFLAQCKDDGTPGENAIEDTYKAALEADSWDIDDTRYEKEGYYAKKGGFEFLFFSYGEKFSFIAFSETES